MQGRSVRAVRAREVYRGKEVRRRSKRRERDAEVIISAEIGTGDGGRETRERKRTGLRLFFFYRAGAGACVRAHAPSWALRRRVSFIGRKRAKDNGSSQTTPKESGRKAKGEASKESSEIRTETSIALHSKNQKINQYHHLLHKDLREYKYQTEQEDVPEP